MKKDIKKIDKKKLKEHIKKYSLLALNIICYICTTIFVISLIVGACTPPKQLPKVEKPVSTMILRDKPVYRANDNTPIYYRSLSDINISTRQSIKLVGGYDTYYVYKNPTSLDVFELFINDIFVNDIYYCPFVEPLYINSEPFGGLCIDRPANGVYRFGLYNNNTQSFSLPIARWFNYEHYINIINPTAYTLVFSGDNQLNVPAFNSISATQKLVYQFWLYYYSQYSIRNVSLEFSDNPITSIQPQLGTSELNNGFFFYNADAFTALNGNYDFVSMITILDGGFSCGGYYYDGIEVAIQSAYNTDNQHPNHYLYGSYPGNPDTDLISRSTNESLKGYFFISAIYFYKYETGGSYVSTMVFSRNKSLDNGATMWNFYENAEYVSSIFKYITIYYISHTSFTFGDFSSISSTYGSYVFVLGNIIPITIVISSDTDYPLFFQQVFSWITYAFYGIMPILTFTLLPGVSLGVVLLVPFVITLILFIVKLFKR